MKISIPTEHGTISVEPDGTPGFVKVAVVRSGQQPKETRVVILNRIECVALVAAIQEAGKPRK